MLIILNSFYDSLDLLIILIILIQINNILFSKIFFKICKFSVLNIMMTKINKIHFLFFI